MSIKKIPPRIIKECAETSGVSFQGAKICLETYIERIAEDFANGKAVDLPGLGQLCGKKRSFSISRSKKLQKQNKG